MNAVLSGTTADPYFGSEVQWRTTGVGTSLRLGVWSDETVPEVREVSCVFVDTSGFRGVRVSSVSVTGGSGAVPQFSAEVPESWM